MQLNKNEIRRQIRNLSQNITPSERKRQSEEVFSVIKEMEGFKAAKNILAYWSMDDEIDTHEFINELYSEGKNIFLPVIDGENLILYRFKGKNNMIRCESFELYEPQRDEALNDYEKIDFAIIPGVAFDTKGNRLGRGKGFYDRLLNQINCTKVGVGFDFQLISHVPSMKHDIPVDIVVCGSGKM